MAFHRLPEDFIHLYESFKVAKTPHTTQILTTDPPAVRREPPILHKLSTVYSETHKRPPKIEVGSLFHWLHFKNMSLSRTKSLRD